MMATFIVPSFIDDNVLNIEYLWGYCDDNGVNLFNHWYKIFLQQ